jgi:hypothetical protein
VKERRGVRQYLIQWVAQFRQEIRDSIDSYVEDVQTFVRAMSHSWGFKVGREL